MNEKKKITINERCTSQVFIWTKNESESMNILKGKIDLCEKWSYTATHCQINNQSSYHMEVPYNSDVILTES